MMRRFLKGCGGLTKSWTPRPGIEPGYPARQAGVLAIGQPRQRIIMNYCFRFLKFALVNYNFSKIQEYI